MPYTRYVYLVTTIEVPFSFCFRDGTPPKSCQLIDKIINEFGMRNIVESQPTSPDHFQNMGNAHEKSEVVLRLRIKWVTKDVAEDY